VARKVDLQTATHLAEGVRVICDYSLQNVKSRPAQIGDKLITFNWGTGTIGFADANELATAVCLLPGTEIAFDKPVTVRVSLFFSKDMESSVAIFRQKDKDAPRAHHDWLEFPDGSDIMLTRLYENQHATVLQLPAAPRNEAEAQEQKRAEYAG
jgi:hypothetical protein